MNGNNSLFRLGSVGGWCSATHFLGNRMLSSSSVCFIRIRDQQTPVPYMKEVVDVLCDELIRLPEMSAAVLYLMSAMKMYGKVPGTLRRLGCITSAQPVQGRNSCIEVTYEKDQRSLVLRIKVKESTKSGQLDLLVEKVE